MRLRKIITSVLVASSLAVGAPAMADAPPVDAGFNSDAWVGYALLATTLGLGVFAVVDTSRSP
jgi:hypothetical protein